MANDVQRANEPRELSEIAHWVAHPIDGAFVSAVFAAIAAMAVYFVSSGSAKACVLSGFLAWCLLFGAYMVVRRVYNLSQDDVPLSFGFDAPFRLSGYKFLNVFLARRLAAGTDFFELRDALSAVRLISSAKDEAGRTLFYVMFHDSGEDGHCVTAIERSLSLLCSEGVLRQHGNSYVITLDGKAKIDAAIETTWDQDPIRMDVLADILGFTREQARRPAA